MATSGTATFNLDLAEIVEEAFERCGGEARTGYDFRTARRSLNLLLMEWANQGVNMWTVEEMSIPLINGVKTYDLPVDTVDVMDAVIRHGTGTGQSDLNLARVSFSTYATMPNKNISGRPSLMQIDRTTVPRITLWPIPQYAAPLTLVYWRMRRIQDAADGVNTMDMPFRFLPALIAGLAHKLAMKLPEALPRLQILQSQYLETWELATGEDRERATLRLVPRITS